MASSPDRFVVDDTKRNMIISRILELISEVEDCTKKINGKADAYRAMTRIHNLPGALHGIDALGGLPAGLTGRGNEIFRVLMIGGSGR